MFALMLKWNLTVRPDWCNLQTHGLSPVGPLICPIRFPFWVNAFPQTVQTNGFSPVCVLMYSSVCLWPSKCLPQTSQSFIWGKLTSEASRFPWSQNVSHTRHTYLHPSCLPAHASRKKDLLEKSLFLCPSDFVFSVRFITLFTFLPVLITLTLCTLSIRKVCLRCFPQTSQTSALFFHASVHISEKCICTGKTLQQLHSVFGFCLL